MLVTLRISLEGVPVQLQAYSCGSWYTITSQQLPSDQCVAWNISYSHRGCSLRMLVSCRFLVAHCPQGGWKLTLPTAVGVHQVAGEAVR